MRLEAWFGCVVLCCVVMCCVVVVVVGLWEVWKTNTATFARNIVIDPVRVPQKRLCELVLASTVG